MGIVYAKGLVKATPLLDTEGLGAALGVYASLGQHCPHSLRGHRKHVLKAVVYLLSRGAEARLHELEEALG
jgi:hypothetical protein